MKEELIGRKAEVAYAGRIFEGQIIDETKNTIRLKTKDKIITIIKKEATLKINNKTVDGGKITKRPEDRIKAC